MWYFIDGAYARPCSACGTPSSNNGCDSCTTPPAQSDNMIYSGPNLSCVDIRTCDTITVAIERINTKLCELSEAIRNLTSTTTTTTTTIVL